MLGLAQGAFALSVPYTYTRSQFGQPIGSEGGRGARYEVEEWLTSDDEAVAETKDD